MTGPPIPRKTFNLFTMLVYNFFFPNSLSNILILDGRVCLRFFNKPTLPFRKINHKMPSPNADCLKSASDFSLQIKKWLIILLKHSININNKCLKEGKTATHTRRLCRSLENAPMSKQEFHRFYGQLFYKGQY